MNRFGALSPRVQCLLLALVSFLMIVTWQELVIRYHYQGNQTGLFCTGSKQHVPEPIRAGTYLFPNSYGYDGEFYRYLAHDPFFQRAFYKNMDDGRYRCQRILVPLLAWTLSGGSDAATDRAYQFVVDASCALGVYWVCSYLLIAGCPVWWGLPVFLLLPATLTSIDRMLVDGPVCALFAGFLYYTKLGRWRQVYLILLFAPLVRDTGYLLVAAAVLASAFERQWKRAALLATAAVPALSWARFVWVHTQPSHAASIIGRPVIGVVERLFMFRTEVQAYPAVQLVVNVVNYLARIGYTLCFVIALKWLWSMRKKEAWTASGIAAMLFLAMGLALGTESYLSEPYAYGRAMSPLFLWIALEAIMRRRPAALVAPLLMSAAVGMYFASPAYRVAIGLLGF